MNYNGNFIGNSMDKYTDLKKEICSKENAYERERYYFFPKLLE